MADAVRDGNGNVIIPASAAGNRGMDPQKPFYVQNVDKNGADVLPSPGAAASASPAVNTSTVTADASGTLAAATPAQLAAANVARQLAIISNTGANPMTVRFGGTASATVGHPIAAGGTLVLDTKCPTAAINGFSTLGTTWMITTG
jgi:hypothetical protein